MADERLGHFPCECWPEISEDVSWSAIAVLVYLWTNAHRPSSIGLYEWTTGYVAVDLNKPHVEVKDAIQELCAADRIVYDMRKGIYLLRDYIPVQYCFRGDFSEKTAKGAYRAYKLLEPKLNDELASAFQEEIDKIPALAEQFANLDNIEFV